MWVCLEDALFSIVAHREEAGSVLVRAKHVGDIEKYWPGTSIVQDHGLDFEQRAVIPRYRVAGVLSEYILRDLTCQQCASIADHLEPVEQDTIESEAAAF